MGGFGGVGSPDGRGKGSLVEGKARDPEPGDAGSNPSSPTSASWDFSSGLVYFYQVGLDQDCLTRKRGANNIFFPV